MFIQVIQGTCTREDEMRAAADRWLEECAPGAEGWLGGTYGFTDDHTFVGVVRFESEEAAMRNSDRPEQTAWWESTERLFDGPVEFRNSDDVLLMLAGGSDDAGFVQVIQGTVEDPEQMRATIDEMSAALREARPDILGATIALGADGSFTQTVGFSDEAAAREGERKELPAEAQQMFDRIPMHGLSYLDLRHPWFETRHRAPSEDQARQ